MAWHRPLRRFQEQIRVVQESFDPVARISTDEGMSIA